MTVLCLSTSAVEQDNACTLSNDGSSESSYLNDYQYATLQQATNDDLSVCMQSSLSHLVKQVYDHSQKCCKKLDIQKVKKINHVTSFSLTCEDGHSKTWTSSPHAEGGKFVANLRMAHGYFTSGMLPVQYRKFCEAANLGMLGDKSIAEMQKTYGEVVEKLVVTSQDDALLEEMAATSLKCEGVAEGIDILTDARHCWRKNARFSDIVCIGDKTHKVLKVETVSKEDERCSQKHELLGVKRVYKYLEDKDCNVVTHSHDRSEERRVGKECRSRWSPYH